MPRVLCRGDRPRGGRASVSSPAAWQLSLQGVWLEPEQREPRSPPPASFIAAPAVQGPLLSRP